MAVRLSRDQNYRWRFWSLSALSSPGPSFLRPKNLGNLPGQKCWEQNAQIVRLNRSLDLEVKMHYLRQSVTDWPAGQSRSSGDIQPSDRSDRRRARKARKPFPSA